MSLVRSGTAKGDDAVSLRADGSRRNVVPELSEYEVEVAGNVTTMQLTAEDAERLGAKPVAVKRIAEPPANKARSAPKNKHVKGE